MPSSQPKVSFIIPAFNAEKSIAQCLEAIFGQVNTVTYEVIVVDNGSSDRTFEIVKNLPVRVFFEGNRGAASARNRGLQEARGQLIAFLDADVIIARDWLYEAMKVFEQQWIDVVQGPNVPASDVPTSFMLQFRRELIAGNTNGSFNYLTNASRGLPQLNTAAMIMRSRFIKQHALTFDVSLQRCEDTDFALQLLYKGAHFFEAPQMRSEVYDSRSPWQYLRRSFFNGRYTALVMHHWGLTLGRPSRTPITDLLSFFMRLNSWVDWLGREYGTQRLQKVSYANKRSSFLAPNLRSSFLTPRLSPFTSFAWLQNSLVIYVLNRNTSYVFSARERDVFWRAIAQSQAIDEQEIETLELLEKGILTYDE